MKRDGDEDRIEPQGTRREQRGPSDQDEQHREIHWIARQPIQTDNDEALVSIC